MALNRRELLSGTAVVGVGALTVGVAQAAAVEPGSASDPIFAEPVIDIDEWRDKPSRHRYVHGGWKGTGAKFLILLPPKEQYQGRFFQHNTAIPTSELTAGNIWGDTFSTFCFESGGACVVTNQSGVSGHPNYASFGIAAAAARYTRVLAQQMYGPHRTYGYAFGGSGGGYRTLSCAEHSDAWDGTVPYIHGNMYAWPNGYAARFRSWRILRQKMPGIADAMEPGGGDPLAKLTDEERGVYLEATRMGFPKRAYVFFETMGVGAMTAIFPNIQVLDSTYFNNDFWSKPGYLGHDRPELFKDIRIQHRTQVKRIIMSDQAAAAGIPPTTSTGNRGTSADPDLAWRTFQIGRGGPLAVAFELENPPPAGAPLEMANMKVVSGAAANGVITFAGMKGNYALFSFGVGGTGFREITEKMKPGDEILIDNSNPLAYETMYRHCLLTPDYYPGNQFRDKKTGKPIYPQREKDISLDLMRGSTPTIPSGSFNGKMIIVQNLVDWDAHPWYADYYRNQVKEKYGAKYTDRYRLWYTDYATHGAVPDPTRIVSFSGVLQQALRDVAAWAERDVAPPQETSYQMQDAQVVVAPRAAARKGIQPVVDLKANGQVRTNVKVGEPVTFTALVEAPPNAGKLVSADWDFDATEKVVAGDAGRFRISEQITPAASVSLKRTYSFTKPGTYYPALKVHAQRQGDQKTQFARIPNLGRVRVVVT